MPPRAQPDPNGPNDALHSVVRTLRELLAGADRDEVRARHSVGEVLRGVKRAPNTYGDGAMDHLAKELGISTSALYRYIAVAEAWTEDDVRALLDRTNTFGRPLSWSHIAALATVTDPDARGALIAHALDGGWTARELERHIERSHRSATRNADAATEGEAVHSALKEGVQTGGRALAEWRTLASALRDRLAEAESPVDERLLEQALTTWEELRNQAEEMVGHLRVASQSQTRLRVAPPAQAVEDDEIEEEEPSGRRRVAPRRGR